MHPTKDQEDNTIMKKQTQNKGKVFILNKPFEGSYADTEGNVAHEIINYFKADNNKIYIYNNPWGHCPSNIDVTSDKEYTLKYMFLTKKATINKEDNNEKSSTFELTHLIEIKKCLHHKSTSKNKEILKKAQKDVKEVIDSEGIAYGGKKIYDIYGEEDDSLYVTFEASKIFKPIKPIFVTTTGYRFQRNKGYVFSNVHEKAFKALEEKLDKKLWKDITKEYRLIDIKNPRFEHQRTFLDLIHKSGSEECFTNMLYHILDYKDTMKEFLKTFAKHGYLSTKHLEVEREYDMPNYEVLGSGRTDICAFNEDQRVVIENKVFSGLNGIKFSEAKDKIIQTQLSVYYEWAKEYNPICFIICPNFRIEEIENEVEDDMKGKYKFIGYKEIASFIESLSKRNNYFTGFISDYIKDIINAFRKYDYKDKSELFEQYFLKEIIKNN